MEPHLDRLKLLEAFITVAETESISRAAQALHVSKSVISQRLSQLEESLGRSLLHRTTRRVSLTEAGAEAYPVCGDIVARVRDLENTLRAAPNHLSGRLRIASAIDIGVKEIAAITSAFHRENPALDLELIVSDSAVSPADDGFDVTLHYRQLVDRRLVQHKVTVVETGLYASPAYLARKGAPDKPEDLPGHDCLGYSQQVTVNAWHTHQWVFQRAGVTSTARVRLKALSNSGHVLRRWAEDGAGLAVLPKFRAASDVAAGTLVPVLTGWSTPSLDLFASHARAQNETLKMTGFITALQAGFENAAQDAARADA
jgi:DNA-binding transcriptional LysR family regulator